MHAARADDFEPGNDGILAGAFAKERVAVLHAQSANERVGCALPEHITGADFEDVACAGDPAGNYDVRAVVADGVEGEIVPVQINPSVKLKMELIV